MSKIIEFNDEEIKLIEKAIGKLTIHYGSRVHNVSKDILEKILRATGFHDLTMYDTETGIPWEISFIFVAFPGLKKTGYRVEGFHQTGTFDGYPSGEFKEFGTLIISDGEIKIIQW